MNNNDRDIQPIVRTLRAFSETLLPLAPCHLSRRTRLKLETDRLSVNAYPNASGGFIYVGIPPHAVPEERDLVVLFEHAANAGIAWLQFSEDGAVVDGLPKFSI